MSKYIVAWETVMETSLNPLKKIVEFEDVQFKDMYIRATDDDAGETYYIPYTSIYDIKYVKNIDE